VTGADRPAGFGADVAPLFKANWTGRQSSHASGRVFARRKKFVEAPPKNWEYAEVDVAARTKVLAVQADE
jgi:hypothetical protein